MAKPGTVTMSKKQATGRKQVERKNPNQRVMRILVEKAKRLRGNVEGHAQLREKMLKASVMLKYGGWKYDNNLLVLNTVLITGFVLLLKLLENYLNIFCKFKGA